MFETREIPNILKAVNIQDLKNEVNILKEQIKNLHKDLCSLQTKVLELETRLTLIEIDLLLQTFNQKILLRINNLFQPLIK